MKNRNYILVDESVRSSGYIVCNDQYGKHSIIETGVINRPEELLMLQQKLF